MCDIVELPAQLDALRLAEFSLDRTADAAIWIRPDARSLYGNDAACRALGYSRQELLSMTVHDIDPNFPALWQITGQ